MNAQGRVTLRILQRADKEILALPRVVKGAVYEFQSKFRADPNHPSMRFKQLKGGSRLYSARVGHDHRALLLHVGGSDYLLVSVKDRKDAYGDLEHYAYEINRVTGGIEVVDLSAVNDSLAGKLLAAKEPAGQQQSASPSWFTPTAAETPGAAAAAPGREAGLFARFDDQTLLGLGVAEPLLPSVRRLTTEEQLLQFTDCVPQLTSDILMALYDGKTADEVEEIVTRPVAAPEPVDTSDYEAAVVRASTPVTSDDEALRAILAESFARWQVFLHPTQRKLADNTYSGPARVSGGPGTGKTIVALHRALYLATDLPEGTTGKPILLTTFNRNLAADLRARLLELAGPEHTARVDIVNIDSLAARVVSEADDARRRAIGQDAEIREWAAMLAELGETRFRPEFLAAEWSQVILGQVLRSRAEYFRARRPGRGRQLTRQDRDVIWQLTERFTKRLADLNVWTWQQVAERAAELEMARASRAAGASPDGENATETSGGAMPRHRYRHVIVDEAQDLSPAHWKLLRAMVAPGPNDLFLVGDTHQRIYDNVVSLGSLGVNIRGRSHKLTLSYRTTRQILKVALELLHGESYDNLDDGTEDLAGYRSLLSGDQPEFLEHPSWDEERRTISAHVRAWLDAERGGRERDGLDGQGDASSAGSPAGGSIAVCVPTRSLAADVLSTLAADGVEAADIGPDGPASGAETAAVHVGTMHRFKGLEYRQIIIAGASQGLVPRGFLDRIQDSDPYRYDRERRKDRSLLFVAATRARDTLLVTWHGTPSPFLGRYATVTKP
ncbi:UvrD-helicase domain-containing protein [Pseudofrankia sp. BMG5.36]|uniref:UvrD-helicase domain-containing protein n=1 Tax=Pseudofrankia sp. BMG5.36 TaxID=1834512 RepID=UPI0008D9E9CA|nr:UvrD-helicase domain-containing protein [Pseudofrankia sp. BMG5.36]OHV62898.1 DNA helicase [Pseudofrankia sp. BMG5.36]